MEGKGKALGATNLSGKESGEEKVPFPVQEKAEGYQEQQEEKPTL